MSAQFFGSHAGALDFGLHVAQQRGAHRFQRLIGHAGQQRAVIGLLSTVDVPVAVGHRMGFGPGGDRVQQTARQSVVGLDLREVGAVLAQVAKERRIVGRDALTDDRNAEPAQVAVPEASRTCRRSP